VEIVDESAQPCPAGQVGQVLVTGLSNMAMPLLRYETGDLAEALDTPCPCGRTLPSFGNIRGRYRRIAFLPPGTWTYWTVFQKEMFLQPQVLLDPLKQYQMHQYRDGSFELRLVTNGPLQPALIERFREIWREAGGASPAPLTIRQVESIPRPPGGKFQNFTSDFMPPRDSDSPDPPTA
jgi:phenylacetate-CoA ligase